MNIIVHTMAEVNQGLAEGRYVRVEIIRDGVLLYQLPGYPIAAPEPRTPVDAYEMAKGYFEAKQIDIRRWLETADVQALQSTHDEGFENWRRFHSIRLPRPPTPASSSFGPSIFPGHTI